MRRIGFEGELYHGTAGSTASTELEIARDVHYNFEPAPADTSDRASNIEYSRTAMVKFGLDFECNNDDSNPFMAAVRSAAASGGTMAFRTKDKASGYGCDGDFNVGLDESQPMKDRQAVKVTLTPNNNTRNMTWA